MSFTYFLYLSFFISNLKYSYHYNESLDNFGTQEQKSNILHSEKETCAQKCCKLTKDFFKYWLKILALSPMVLIYYKPRIVITGIDNYITQNIADLLVGYTLVFLNALAFINLTIFIGNLCNLYDTDEDIVYDSIPKSEKKKLAMEIENHQEYQKEQNKISESNKVKQKKYKMDSQEFKEDAGKVRTEQLERFDFTSQLGYRFDSGIISERKLDDQFSGEPSDDVYKQTDR